MMDFSKVENIVFDLGGVIIDIDFNETFLKFSKITGLPLEETVSRIEKNLLFKNYETGQLTEPEFFKTLQELFGKEISHDLYRHAWNALLLKLPKTRVELIKELKSKYNVYLLSNTNYTHIQKVNEILYESCGENDLKNLFHKTYYSYEINLTKPHIEIYNFVAKDCSLNPEVTVFLDDTLPNLVGAEKAGWKTLHVKEFDILQLLKNA